VKLNQCDQLWTVGFQSNSGQNTVGVDEGATSLTFEAILQALA